MVLGLFHRTSVCVCPNWGHRVIGLVNTNQIADETCKGNRADVISEWVGERTVNQRFDLTAQLDGIKNGGAFWLAGHAVWTSDKAFW